MAKTILLVEDSASMRKVVSGVLQGGNHIVVEAGDAKEGLAKVNSKIDLIISDFNMPDMDGLDMVEKIKEIPSCKSIPIIMLTSEANIELKNRGKALAINAWMIKPFAPEKILFAVDKLT